MASIGINIFNILVGIVLIVLARRSGDVIKIKSSHVVGFGTVLILINAAIAYQQSTQTTTKKKVTFEEQQPQAYGRRGIRRKYSYKR